MTKIEIIELVASTYNLNNRSIDENDRCLYQSSDGKRCGVSIFLTEETDRLKLSELNMSGITYLLKHGTLTKDNFIPEVQATVEDIGFWNQIQVLHDCLRNWDEKGLSLEGEKYVEELKSYHLQNLQMIITNKKDWELLVEQVPMRNNILFNSEDEVSPIDFDKEVIEIITMGNMETIKRIPKYEN